MLRDKLNDAMKEAMRARDQAALGTIRLILAKLKDVDIAARTEASREGVADDKILSMMQGMIKQRNESIVLYEKGNRADLADKEKAEIAVIERFLPQQMDEAAVEAAVREAVAAAGATTVKDMGGVMAALKAKYAGQMDFAKASAAVKKALTRLIFPVYPLRRRWRRRGAGSAIFRRHGVSTGFPRRTARAPQPVRRRRPQGVAEASLGQRIRRPLPVPQREDPVLHGQRQEGLLSLLRLRRARRRRRLRDEDRGPFLPRVGREARARGQSAGAARRRRPSANAPNAPRPCRRSSNWRHAGSRSSLRLPVGRHGLDYLRGRGLSDETIDDFRLGFAPDSRDGVIAALKRENVPIDKIVEAGLAIQPEDNREPYDRFRGRVMFPIDDRRGRDDRLRRTRHGRGRAEVSQLARDAAVPQGRQSLLP